MIFFLCRLLLLAPFLSALITVGVLAAHEPTGQAPPDQASRKEARALIFEAFEDDFQQAKTRQQKQLLAQKLLHVAAETLEHPAGRFELLEIARQQAIQAGDGDVALLAIKELGTAFEVDTLRLRAAALYQLSKSLSRPDELKLLVSKMVALVDESLAIDRYDIAVPLTKVTTATARAARDKELSEMVASQRALVEMMQAAYEAVQPALETLQEDPRDAAANLTVGRYECLLQGRWDEGLPRLAAGADERLRELATIEIGVSPNALALGDGWWQLAENETGRAQKNLRTRAVMWYRNALPSMSGLAKIRLEKRLQEFEEEAMQPAAPPAPRAPVLPGAPEAKAPPPAEQLQMAKFGLNWLAQNQLQDGSWTFQNGADPGSHDSRIAATAMSVLAFLRHGHTHEVGNYRQQVKQGLAAC